MRLLPNHRQIYISARLWHEIDAKVRLAAFKQYVAAIFSVDKRYEVVMAT